MSHLTEVLKRQVDNVDACREFGDDLSHTVSAISHNQHPLDQSIKDNDAQSVAFFENFISQLKSRTVYENEALQDCYGVAAEILVEHEAELFELAIIEGHMRGQSPRVDSPLVIGLPPTDS